MSQYIIRNLNESINIEVYYFNSEIISKIKSLSNELNTLHDYNKIQRSLDNPDAHPKTEESVKRIGQLFNENIELIRHDLQIDNKYIQDFLTKYRNFD